MCQRMWPKSLAVYPVSAAAKGRRERRALTAVRVLRAKTDWTEGTVRSGLPTALHRRPIRLTDNVAIRAAYTNHIPTILTLGATARPSPNAAFAFFLPVGMQAGTGRTDRVVPRAGTVRSCARMSFCLLLLGATASLPICRCCWQAGRCWQGWARRQGRQTWREGQGWPRGQGWYGCYCAGVAGCGWVCFCSGR